MARIKGNISQEILIKLLTRGKVVIDKQAPRFWLEVYRQLFRDKPLKERAAKDAFYYLKKKNLIVGELKSDQLHIKLASAGAKEAKKYQINKLKIKRPGQWDKKWRLVINISKNEQVSRNLEGLGFHQLQKNIWVIPFPCEKEIKLLRQFFNLETKDLRLIEADKIEEDHYLRGVFPIGV